jgi:hypothetical protein
MQNVCLVEAACSWVKSCPRENDPNWKTGGKAMRTSLLLAALSLACVPLLSSDPAHAATRTWVSGVGDDLNPCSRTAPCKTFAGAISKTDPNGIINCVDPGGFGSVTITKSITIAPAGASQDARLRGARGLKTSEPHRGGV